jgi:hypothetical protein
LGYNLRNYFLRFSASTFQGHSLILNRFSLLAALILACMLLNPKAQASAYIGTQDKQLHYDLQTLVEWGYLDTTVNTFPVPWKGVAIALSDLSTDGMSFRPLQAYLRLNHYLYLNKQQQNRRFISLQGASDTVRFRSLDDGVEGTNKITASSEFYFGRFSGQLAMSHTNSGSSKTYLDNSFIAYQFGDWNLRLGSIDQWWGPAQSSSLILSNNARPIKALALSRSVNTASQNPFFSWIGPWYFTTQIGQLEKDRAVPNAKIFMNRLNARPIKGLELGLSWVAMWGGDGVNNGFEDFLDVVTFQTLCVNGSEQCDESLRGKSGNHIGSFDISYTAQLFERPVTFYVQRAGEDVSNHFKVSDNANLIGISTYFKGAKVFLETSDTTVSCSTNAQVNDCFYEDSQYTDGYRLYKRAIGSTFDSDAKQITLGTNFRFQSGDTVELYLRSVTLNEDASKPSPVITTGNTEEVLELSGFYQKPVGNWLLKVGGSVAKRSFAMQSDSVDSVVYAKAQFAF